MLCLKRFESQENQPRTSFTSRAEPKPGPRTDTKLTRNGSGFPSGSFRFSFLGCFYFFGIFTSAEHLVWMCAQFTFPAVFLHSLNSWLLQLWPLRRTPWKDWPEFCSRVVFFFSPAAIWTPIKLHWWVHTWQNDKSHQFWSVCVEECSTGQHPQFSLIRADMSLEHISKPDVVLSAPHCIVGAL